MTKILYPTPQARFGTFFYRLISKFYYVNSIKRIAFHLPEKKILDQINIIPLLRAPESVHHADEV